MKITRLLEIVTILLNRETVTAKELSDRFTVSVRTIYRDIDVLSAAGVPVYMKKGHGGGISLLEDYTLSRTMLSQKESEGLLLAIQTMGATNYPETDTILNKLGSIFKGNKAHDWIEVDFEGWSSKVNEQSRFTIIRDAIVSNKIISFDYINSNGDKSSRYAEPAKLLFRTNTWYLIAYCLKRDSHRIFRLSRIKNAKITDKCFIRREMQEHEKKMAYVPLVKLKLRCNENIMHRIYDTFDGDCISKNDDGSFDIIVSIPEDEWVYGYILSFGDSAEVIEPNHIREIIKSRAKEIVEKY